MNVFRLLPLLLLALLLGACGAVVPMSAPSGASAPEFAPAREEMAPQAMPEAAALEQVGAAVPQQDQLPQIDRLVIKSADLSLEVESVRDAEAAVRARVAALGGYVVKVETNGADQSQTSRITFRVPAQRFDEALAGVQGLAKKVLARTVSGDDVTEEFVDLDSRLRNLEATRDRLLSFLDKASNVEQALQINQALSEVQGQIEQIRGRMQYLKQSAALSTISVFLTPVPVTPIVEEGAWQPLQVARAALRDLVAFGQGLASVAIVLLVWAPIWLPFLVLGLWIRRRLARRPAAAPAPEAT